MLNTSHMQHVMEYVFTYFSWGYFYFSAGYFCYDKFHIHHPMRILQRNGPIAC